MPRTRPIASTTVDFESIACSSTSGFTLCESFRAPMDALGEPIGPRTSIEYEHKVLRLLNASVGITLLNAKLLQLLC